MLILEATGNVGLAPRVKEVKGKTVAEMRMAVNRSRNSTLMVWVQVDFWGDHAALAEAALRKGDFTRVEGLYWPAAYKDRSGNAQPSVRIAARRVGVWDKAAKEWRMILGDSFNAAE